MIVDQFSDQTSPAPHRVLVKLSAHSDLLSKVGGVDLTQPELSPQAYAWESEQLFPMHTPEHALLSYAYATKQAQEGLAVPAGVIEKLARACELWKVEVPASLSEEKTASAAPVNYLLPQYQAYNFAKLEDGPELAFHFMQQSRGLKLSTISQFATNFVKTAAALGAMPDDVPPVIYKYAGLTSCDAGVLWEWLEARAVACGENEEARAVYEKMASAVETNFPRSGVIEDRGELVKIAVALEEADRKAGLTHLYASRILDPMATVFNMDKLAMPTQITLGNKTFNTDQLLSVPPEVYADVLGEEFVEGAKDPTTGELEPELFMSILQTLPADEHGPLVSTLAPYIAAY